MTPTAQVLDLTGLGTRIAKRAGEVQQMLRRGGRQIATNSWLTREVTWLAEHAAAVNRWAAPRSQ